MHFQNHLNEKIFWRKELKFIFQLSFQNQKKLHDNRKFYSKIMGLFPKLIEIYFGFLIEKRGI